MPRTRVRKYLASKTASATLNQVVAEAELEALAEGSPGLQELTLTSEDGEDDDLDFSCLHLPELKKLTVDGAGLDSVCFTTENTPALKHLTLKGVVCQGDFELELPELQRLQMEYVDVGGSCDAFGSSLSACPRLQVLSTYKFWGYLVEVFEMDLPSCQDFVIMRSDALGGLLLTAPELTLLRLYSNHEMQVLQLLPRSGPPCVVDLWNCTLEPQWLAKLKSHPRVGKQGLLRYEPPPEF